MNELLDPRNDFLFKRIFGSEENQDVLLAFLNRSYLTAMIWKNALYFIGVSCIPRS
jgi:hypothetical protein